MPTGRALSALAAPWCPPPRRTPSPRGLKTPTGSDRCSGASSGIAAPADAVAASGSVAAWRGEFPSAPHTAAGGGGGGDSERGGGGSAAAASPLSLRGPSCGRSGSDLCDVSQQQQQHHHHKQDEEEEEEEGEQEEQGRRGGGVFVSVDEWEGDDEVVYQRVHIPDALAHDEDAVVAWMVELSGPSGGFYMLDDAHRAMVPPLSYDSHVTHRRFHQQAAAAVPAATAKGGDAIGGGGGRPIAAAAARGGGFSNGWLAAAPSNVSLDSCDAVGSGGGSASPSPHRDCSASGGGGTGISKSEQPPLPLNGACTSPTHCSSSTVVAAWDAERGRGPQHQQQQQQRGTATAIPATPMTNASDSTSSISTVGGRGVVRRHVYFPVSAHWSPSPPQQQQQQQQQRPSHQFPRSWPLSPAPPLPAPPLPLTHDAAVTPTVTATATEGAESVGLNEEDIAMIIATGELDDFAFDDDDDASALDGLDAEERQWIEEQLRAENAGGADDDDLFF